MPTKTLSSWNRSEESGDAASLLTGGEFDVKP